MDIKFDVVNIEIPEDCNVILGQSHFIKTAEDLYETIKGINPGIKFGIAFSEASGPCLIRYEGNDEKLTECAVKNSEKLSAGHTFVIVMKEGFPINIKNALMNVPEVLNIFAATANPIQAIIAETDLGRGIMGVIDGFKPLGTETDEDKKNRWNFLRSVTGYKK
ncbi:MAG: adenosine-specific kinase [Thermotogae bacterium]|nr:adenosine-specific kinase [Thermotogota bacterium]